MGYHGLMLRCVTELLIIVIYDMLTERQNKQTNKQTNKQKLRSFQSNLLTYINILEEYKESISYRSQQEHGIHDYVENKRHAILRSKEASARVLVRPSAVLESIQTLNFQNRNINQLDEDLVHMFPNLMSLSVSGNNLKILQNLPISLCAMHACGCKIETIDSTGMIIILFLSFDHIYIQNNRIAYFYDSSRNCIQRHIKH